LRTGQGIGFAIPIKRVSEALAEIFTPESVRSLWLGARFEHGPKGLATANVQPGSPAEKAGLRRGDRVVQVNDKMPKNLVELNRELIAAGARTVELTIQRNGERKNLAVELVPEKDFFTPGLIRQKMGATLQLLDENLAREFGLDNLEALVITSVDHGGPADRAELRRGYIIQAIDGQVPRDLVQAAKILYNKKRGEQAHLNLIVTRSRGRLLQLFQATADVDLR